MIKNCYKKCQQNCFQISCVGNVSVLALELVLTSNFFWDYQIWRKTFQDHDLDSQYQLYSKENRNISLYMILIITFLVAYLLSCGAIYFSRYKANQKGKLLTKYLLILTHMMYFWTCLSFLSNSFNSFNYFFEVSSKKGVCFSSSNKKIDCKVAFELRFLRVFSITCMVCCSIFCSLIVKTSNTHIV